LTGGIFTFLGEKTARLGYVFVYEGEAAACRRCDFSRVCHGKLKPNLAYKVVEVRDKRIECPVLGEAVLVRVEKAPVKVAIRVEQAVEGALIKFTPQECGRLSCEYFSLCVPTALSSGGAYKIIEVLGFFNCPVRGVRLAQVYLQPQP